MPQDKVLVPRIRVEAWKSGFRAFTEPSAYVQAEFDNEDVAKTWAWNMLRNGYTVKTHLHREEVNHEGESEMERPQISLSPAG